MITFIEIELVNLSTESLGPSMASIKWVTWHAREFKIKGQIGETKWQNYKWSLNFNLIKKNGLSTYFMQ